MENHLDIYAVAERYGVSKITIRRWWGKGIFPPPIRFSPRVLRWRKIDLDAFDKRTAQRNKVDARRN